MRAKPPSNAIVSPKKVLRVGLLEFPPRVHNASVFEHVVNALRTETRDLKNKALNVEITVETDALKKNPEKPQSYGYAMRYQNAIPILTPFRELKKKYDLLFVLGGNHAFAFPTYVDIPHDGIVARFDNHGDADKVDESERFTISNVNYVRHALQRTPLPGEDPLTEVKIVNFGNPSDITLRVGTTRSANEAKKFSNIDTLCIDMDSFHPKYGVPTHHTQSDASPRSVLEAFSASADATRVVNFFEYRSDTYPNFKKTASVMGSLARLILRAKAKHLASGSE